MSALSILGCPGSDVGDVLCPRTRWEASPVGRRLCVALLPGSQGPHTENCLPYWILSPNPFPGNLHCAPSTPASPTREKATCVVAAIVGFGTRCGPHLSSPTN